MIFNLGYKDFKISRNTEAEEESIRDLLYRVPINEIKPSNKLSDGFLLLFSEDRDQTLTNTYNYFIRNARFFFHFFSKILSKF